MHRDRSTAMLNPHKRDMRDEWGRRSPDKHDGDDGREHGTGKALRTHGVREREALHQIRELRARSL